MTYIVATKVRLQLSCQNLQRGTLSNTVGTDKSEYLTGARSGETMKLERVRSITVRDLRFKVGGEGRVFRGHGSKSNFLLFVPSRWALNAVSSSIMRSASCALQLWSHLGDRT